jgi:hypothetical protein
MMSRKILLDALQYVAGRKCVSCSPTEKLPAATEPCSHVAARKALAEHEKVEAARLARFAHHRR